MSASYMVHLYLDHRLYPLPLFRDRHHPRLHPQLPRDPRRYNRGHAPQPSMAPQLPRRVSLRGLYNLPFIDDFRYSALSNKSFLPIEIIRVYLLLKIVSRARLVLDYSITLLLYHVLMVTMYSDHVPSTFLWWALNGTTCGIMIFGGEYVCMQQEMEPIILGGSGGSQSNTNNNTSSGHSNNPNSNNTSGGGASSSSGALASQGASLSGMHDGYGNYEESAGLLMETLDHSNNGDLSNHMSLSGSSRTMPTKARSSEEIGRAHV